MDQKKKREQRVRMQRMKMMGQSLKISTLSWKISKKLLKESNLALREKVSQQFLTLAGEMLELSFKFALSFK
jgi:hypothetical protein